MVFKIEKKSKWKFLLDSMLLTNFEHVFQLSSSPSETYNDNLILRMLTGSRLWSWKLYIWENRPIEERDAKTKISQWQGKKAGQKFCFFFRKFFELVSVFKEASKNFIIIFSCRRKVKNFKPICSCTESTDLIAKIFDL